MWHCTAFLATTRKATNRWPVALPDAHEWIDCLGRCLMPTYDLWIGGLRHCWMPTNELIDFDIFGCLPMNRWPEALSDALHTYALVAWGIVGCLPMIWWPQAFSDAQLWIGGLRHSWMPPMNRWTEALSDAHLWKVGLRHFSNILLLIWQRYRRFIKMYLTSSSYYRVYLVDLR